MSPNLMSQVVRAGDAPALVFDEEVMSYAEFHAAVGDLAEHLAALELPPGARVGIADLPPARLLVAAYACFTGNLTAVPVLGGDRARNTAALAAAQIEAIIDGSLEPVRTEATGARRRPEVALIVHTSGTTQSTRKGVLLGHESIGATCAFMNRAMDIAPDVREVVFAQVDHAFGFGRCHSVLSVGGTVMLSGGLRLGDLFTWLAEGATALSTTPSTLATLISRRPDELAEAAASVRWVQTGAMRFDRSMRDRLCELLPGARVFAHYGLSEAMRSTFIELQAHPDKRHTEGRPADGVLIEIRDRETGATLPQGEEGTIAISGANLCLGYTDDALWEAATHDGWYLTNDLGRLDEDGYLVFAGRSDDVINANGNIVHPDEIEARLAPLLPAGEYSVLGLPDPDGVRDAVVVLCVEGAQPPTLRDVRSTMAAAPDFMVPKRIVSIDALPRTATGKVNRAALARLVGPSR